MKKAAVILLPCLALAACYLLYHLASTEVSKVLDEKIVSDKTYKIIDIGECTMDFCGAEIIDSDGNKKYVLVRSGAIKGALVEQYMANKYRFVK